MKRFLTLLLITGLFTSLQATNWLEISSGQDYESKVELLSSNISKTTLQLNLSGFWYNEVETERGTAWAINIEGSANRLEKGKPSLPLFATSLIIPANAKMVVEVVGSSFVEYENVLIAPSKGSISRSIDPATVPYEFGPQYKRDEFFPLSTSTLRQPYIVRDYRGQTVLINPFSYNPITKVLRVYSEITVQITENGISNINTATNVEPEKIDASFQSIYKSHFLNYQASAQRYDPVDDHGNMLIIAHGDFMDGMDDYIDWKTKTGTEIEMVDVATIGGAPQIKTYIADYYNNNGLTFVLLIGDSQQLPSSTLSSFDSDQDYAYIVGNDRYPDIFVGRFSAENTSHVATMVQRTIDYERYPSDTASWYKNAIGIASNQGPGDDDEFDFAHIRNIQDSKLIPFTYDYAYELFDGSQGGEDADGHPTPAMVEEAVNSGASIINYTGHGGTTSWVSSNFSNSDVNNLTNVDKLPFIISVACVNGNFVNNTCFAEAWTRAEDNGSPTGAIAVFMSTNNQDWAPPMRGQDEMNDILTEVYEDNIKRTFGGICINGCMNMNDNYGNDGYLTTDTWTIFGDPSLLLRTTTAQIMTASHPATIFLGSTSLTVNSDAEGGTAALTMNGEIIGTATIEGGVATIMFDPLNNIGTMDLVITSFNYSPYESTVEIVPAEGPYVINVGNTVDDSNGNNNGFVDYTESILLTLDQANVGIEDALNINCVLSSESEFVTITDSIEDYGTIAVADTVSVQNGFAFDVAGNIPDETKIFFNISSEDGETREVWESAFFIMAHAPALNFSSFTIDDNSGNQNGKIDPGETVDFIVDLSNNGSSEAFSVIGNLTSSNQYITINSFDVAYGDMAGNDTISGIFSVTADMETPEGTEAEFEITITAEYGINSNSSFSTFIGQKPVLIIDLASGTGSPEAMMECFDELNVGADLQTDSFPEEINIYQSIFIILGVYPDNHVLTVEEGSLLDLFLEGGGRIYMEGGDTWYYDQQTTVHPKFFINGLADGADDLGRIIGHSDGWLQNYAFNYDGPNSYIDRLGPMTESIVILQNESPAYGTAISHENDVYKTIGSSACFGGLVDEEGSTKDGLMAEYLYFFDISFLWTGTEENSISENTVSAYPNPFNRTVNISLNLDKLQNVEVSIYNLTGKKVASLINQEQQLGKHIYSWDAKDAPAGIYFYSVKAGDQSFIRKLILTK